MQTPWLKEYIKATATAPLPLIPQRLQRFPTRWPFPRGDLYHWIPLLNRFDNILACAIATYKLADGPQTRDFGCDILQNDNVDVEHRSDHQWTMFELSKLGYKEDGDGQLLGSILEFSSMLLQHCGNRSIYASSPYLSDLLNTTSLTVVISTLDVGYQLALRYQASVKRMAVQSRQLNTALLANHYNIDLERVAQLAQPFAKTPTAHLGADALLTTIPGTPAGKGKDKVPSSIAAKNTTSMFANDLVAIATPDQPDDGRWNGWGDVKISYIPESSKAHDDIQDSSMEPGSTSLPATPTPLRRSSTGPQHRSPRAERSGAGSVDESTSPIAHIRPGSEEHVAPNVKFFELSHDTVLSTPIHELLPLCPSDMPKASRFQLLNRLRIAKALLGSSETRQLALAVRLMAVINLAYIQTEETFVEKTLKHDNDEPRRYQLAYQLAELIHPSTVGAATMPLWLQSVALRLLEGLSNFSTKYSDVLSALNANVNHGILLYVLRKTVAGIEEEKSETDERATEEDDWRNHLFSLTLHMTTGPQRVGTDMVTAGLMEVLVDILNIRTRTADRCFALVLAFLDTVLYGIPGAFQSFISVQGLESIAKLTIYAVASAKSQVESGEGTKAELRSTVVDYEIPYYKQQTLKWSLKLLHHFMSSSFSYGGNADRRLRNLVDDSDLLRALRSMTEATSLFGSMVWTNAVSILGDFINNDPTSFSAIAESGMIKSFLEAVTGRPVIEQSKEATEQSNGGLPRNNGEEQPSLPESDEAVIFDADERRHPPSMEDLEMPREAPLARGILPSMEAIAIIPSVLNAFCLNHVGMKMIVSSRVFDSYFEIFESPAHIRYLLSESGEIATSIGGSFEELARHHPSLRAAISNAVLDMVARIVHLGRTKPESAGWGTKLFAPYPVRSRKGKEKALLGDDVEMLDISEDSGPNPGTGTGTGDVLSTESDNSSIEMASYISAVGIFLDQYLANRELRLLFVQNGGVELVLDLLESPSLTHEFVGNNAGKGLEHVVVQLVEQSPILVWAVAPSPDAGCGRRLRAACHEHWS